MVISSDASVLKVDTLLCYLKGKSCLSLFALRFGSSSKKQAAEFSFLVEIEKNYSSQT